MPQLDGYVALVTGGASGIGRGVTQRFVAEGARVVVLDRSVEPFGEMEDDAVAVVGGNVSRYQDNQDAVELALDRFGRLDVVVANAGISDGFRPLAEFDAATLQSVLDEVLRVNVGGAIYAVHAALSSLVEFRGSVILTLSNAARSAGGGGVAYTASKHACLGVVRQLAFELAPYVRVNAVAPGGTLTGFRSALALGEGPDGHGTFANPQEGLAAMIEALTPLRAAAEPADHAGAYVLLASREQSQVTTGAVIDTDAGLSVRGITSLRGGDDLPSSLGVTVRD